MDLAGFMAFVSGLLEFLVSGYGLLGVFLASFIANATVFFIIPFDIVVFGLGAAGIHPILLGIVVGLGAVCGEMVAYLVGLGGGKAFERVSGKDIDLLYKTEKEIENRGAALIFFLALIPFPFDLVGIACGVLGYNILKFFAATFAGKALRFTIVAYAGFIGLEAVKSFFLFG